MNVNRQITMPNTLYYNGSIIVTIIIIIVITNPNQLCTSSPALEKSEG